MHQDTPKQVRRAIYLLWASLVIGVLVVALDWEAIESDLGEFKTTMLVIFALSFAVPAMLVYFISRRHNWARILMLVLTLGGNALYIAWPIEGPPEPWSSIVVTMGITVMDLAALYWLFSGSGAEWFSRRAQV